MIQVHLGCLPIYNIAIRDVHEHVSNRGHTIVLLRLYDYDIVQMIYKQERTRIEFCWKKSAVCGLYSEERITIGIKEEGRNSG